MSGFRQCLGGNNLIIEVNSFHSIAPVCSQFCQFVPSGRAGKDPFSPPATQGQQEGNVCGKTRKKQNKKGSCSV